MGARQTRFMADRRPVKSLDDGEVAVFLGADVGFRIVPRMSTVAEVVQLCLKVLRSKLSLWQRLEALRTFVTSSVNHLLINDGQHTEDKLGG